MSWGHTDVWLAGANRYFQILEFAFSQVVLCSGKPPIKKKVSCQTASILRCGLCHTLHPTTCNPFPISTRIIQRPVSLSPR